MDVVGGVVARYYLAGRGIERMDVSGSGEVRCVIFRFGGGYGPVAKDGLAILNQFEAFFHRCITGGREPEQAYGVFVTGNLLCLHRFSESEDQGDFVKDD